MSQKFKKFTCWQLIFLEERKQTVLGEKECNCIQILKKLLGLSVKNGQTNVIVLNWKNRDNGFVALKGL